MIHVAGDIEKRVNKLAESHGCSPAALILLALDALESLHSRKSNPVDFEEEVNLDEDI